MEVIGYIAEIKKKLAEFRTEGKTVGLVPTMGALHQGHLQLVKRSIKENNVTVVSIFVNPNQFNNLDDLRTYPRTMEADLEMLDRLDVGLVFAPDDKEMYPEPDLRIFDFGYLDSVMEGEKRPKHFNGVAQVVSKLFDIVSPDKAYFGLKDFQQVAIVKQVVKNMSFNVEIVSCPIVREKDGLAMSSRNVRLSTEQRKNACEIYKTLLKARNLTGCLSVFELKDWVINQINKNHYLEVEYFEVVDSVSLKSVRSWDEDNKKVGCIAVFVGKVRLIDNINL